MAMKSKPRVELDTQETARYQGYSMRWRGGEGIPQLAEEANVTNREMHSRIALACKVKRFSLEMRAWKRECNRERRALEELRTV